MEKITQNFAQRLAGRRSIMGFTQQELADLLGVHIRTVQNWEGGTSEPRGKDLRKVCEVLHTDIAYLLGSAPASESIPYRLNDAAPSELRHTIITHNPAAAEIVTHLRDFLARCGDDSSRLGWTLVEIKSHFPLDKWGRPPATYQKVGRATLKTDPSVDAAAQELLEEEGNDPK